MDLDSDGLYESVDKVADGRYESVYDKAASGLYKSADLVVDSLLLAAV